MRARAWIVWMTVFGVGQRGRSVCGFVDVVAMTAENIGCAVLNNVGVLGLVDLTTETRYRWPYQSSECNWKP